MNAATGFSNIDSRATTPKSLQDIAHELRQPLSAIESIAYYLSLVLPHEDPKLQGQINRLQQLVEQSDWILANGVHLAESIVTAPELIDFNELLTESIASRAWPANRAPRMELADNLALVNIDPGLGRALLGNLLTLFRQLATESYPAIIRTSISGSGVALELETAVPGYRSESALGPGGALSLACAHRIAEAHRGSLESAVDVNTGIRVRVILPA
jgi:signal transduction histidine kinase